QICNRRDNFLEVDDRTYLRQRVEARLASLLMESKEYSEALSLLSGLITEVRRLDDKLLDRCIITYLYLLESKLHFSLRKTYIDTSKLLSLRCERERTWNPK
ncbi:unnamed protein product, partial [Prunus brigantina]